MLRAYYNETVEKVLDMLKTSHEGLKDPEVAKRRERYGMNLLPKKKKDGILKIFFSQFFDPLILLLLIAVVASIMVSEIVDALVIVGITLANAIMGTFQENRANKTADSLASLMRININVLRNGQMLPIDSELIVPGDIVFLESGNKVPADMRLIEAHNLSIDESILTGESVNVVKNSAQVGGEKTSLSDRTNIVYSGTTVVSGRAKAVVVATGSDTELGKIADRMNKTDESQSPLTIRVNKLSRQITVMIAITAILATILLVTKRVEPTEILITVIAFAVSAMPEGLPLALTMALTIASNRMAKRNVIVRKLKAAESLGSCTVIASDKTGTLTVNQQTAKKIILPNGYEYDISGVGYDIHGEIKGVGEASNKLDLAQRVGLLGEINNEAKEDADGASFTGDSIDIAFRVLARKLKVASDDIKIIENIPYESENKYSAVFYEEKGELRCAVKGSLEVVLDFCGDANFIKSKDKNVIKQVLEAQNEALASDGFRVLALADGKIERKNGKNEKYAPHDIENLTFMGMTAFIDPMRKQAKDSIADCRRAGIKALMITGDHPLTAFSIARDLNLAKNREQVATGDEVEKAYGIGEHEFDAFVREKVVFARVTPLQKLNIVESLKRQGEFVAVTGDGVNDAPALKSANIGVAMGSGTDIARETADMIIVDDNFKSIVSGIEEGRIAYANIRKIMYYLLSCGLAEALFFCLSILFNLPAPLTAVQFLWLNIVTDSFQTFALSFERGEDSVLKEKPRNTNESIFDRPLLVRILSSGIVISIIVFAVWAVLLKIFGFEQNIAEARGYTLCLMVFMQNMHVLNCRSEKHSLFSVSLLKNPMIIFTISGNILLQFVVMFFAPLSTLLDAGSIPLPHMALLFAISLLIIPIVELIKALTSIRRRA